MTLNEGQSCNVQVCVRVRMRVRKLPGFLQRGLIVTLAVQGRLRSCWRRHYVQMRRENDSACDQVPS